MGTKYAKHLKSTPQTEPIREDQVKNSAGGYVWSVDDWVRLDRFLVLGAEGNTYYATERKMVKENAQAVARCVKEDGVRVVRRILEISDAGRAYKNDPALFALALAFAGGDADTRQEARAALPKIARTGTHLFTITEYLCALSGMGRRVRGALADWYTEKTIDQLVFQTAKYQSRDKWSHRDVLRLAHPQPREPQRNALYQYLVGKVDRFDHPLLDAIKVAHSSTPKEIAALVRDRRLTREMLPTQALTEPAVWSALLEHMPAHAMIRNLPTMTRIGLLAPLGDELKHVVTQLGDREWLRKARVHPIQILAALLTYKQGRGTRAQHDASAVWVPQGEIVDALDAAFYLTFENVVPTDKRLLYALDVSSSMNDGTCGGVPGLSPRIATAALAMVAAKTEPNRAFVAFTHQLVPIDIGKHRRLDDVVQAMRELPFGGTDCALPMKWASDNKVKVDGFVVLTDMETWAGPKHVSERLRDYRRAFGIQSKLATVGMVSNGFSIADPNDAGQMDFVGFDTNTPAVLADFLRE